MRLGVVVRMDDRGLAHLTQEFARHMRPERVLVVDMNDPRFPLRANAWLENRPGLGFFYASHIDGFLHGPVDRFLDGLTHVYTAETGYDREFFAWCRKRGVASICHVMPEFDRFTSGEIVDKPDAVWLPTRWRADKVAGAKVVPVPVPVAPRPRQRTEARTFVHVIGCRAKPDRAGTLSVFRAIRMTPDVQWRLFAQDVRGGMPSALSGCKNVEIHYGSLADRWALYDDADVLVAPRRFGGLSLPVLEANACGVPVIMGDHDPMMGYGSVFVPSRLVDTFEAAGGAIPVFECPAEEIAAAVETCAKGNRFSSGVNIARESQISLDVATADGWPGKVDEYRALIEGVRS